MTFEVEFGAGCWGGVCIYGKSFIWTYCLSTLQVVKISFDYFFLANGTADQVCPYEAVGILAYREFGSVYCGSERPPDFTSSGRHVDMVYYCHTTKRGAFSATITFVDPAPM